MQCIFLLTLAQALVYRNWAVMKNHRPRSTLPVSWCRPMAQAEVSRKSRYHDRRTSADGGVLGECKGAITRMVVQAGPP